MSQRDFTRRARMGVYLLGFFALATTHFAFLRRAPAFHLDEAWAALYSHRIATESHFWPLQAMSPYTMAWSHYITALVFRCFGTNLWNYRATGIVEVLLGVGLISASLEVLEERLAAALLPLVVGFFPTLVMNHRWVFEMNTFFVLCAGLVFLGFALRWKRGPSLASGILMVLGCFLATSSHILFLASTLSVWIYFLLRGKLGDWRDRAVVLTIALLVLPFFFLIAKTDSAPGRGIALIVLDCAVVGVSLWPAPIRAMPERFRRGLLLALVACGLPLLIPFAILGDGTWLELFFSGRLSTPYLIGTIFIPLILTVLWLPSEARPGARMLLRLEPVCLIPLSLLITQAMIVKPGPRYFEIQYLFFAVLLALALTRLPIKKRATVLSLWVVLGSALLSIGYFAPALRQEQVAREYRFLIFHDASFDMLPKLKLVDALAARGCTYGDLNIRDDRIQQTLQFLSYGDWPTPRAGGCGLGRPLIDSSSWRNCCSGQ